MDGIEDTEDVFTEDAGITAIAVDSLNGSVNNSCNRKITCICCTSHGMVQVYDVQYITLCKCYTYLFALNFVFSYFYICAHINTCVYIINEYIFFSFLSAKYSGYLERI